MVKIITSASEKRLKIEVDKLYKSFILKTRTLGMDCSFTYRVTGDDVTLDRYTGSSKHAVVPKFVTIIGRDAFNSKKITNISLNDGLRLIRTRAFAYNSLMEVDIPKTVIMIKHRAFLDNKGLVKETLRNNGSYTYELDKEKFRVYSNDTNVETQIL